jgi:hypothetical protein
MAESDPIKKVGDMAAQLENRREADPLDQRFPPELIEFIKATAEAIKALQAEIHALAEKVDKKLQ